MSFFAPESVRPRIFEEALNLSRSDGLHPGVALDRVCNIHRGETAPILNARVAPRLEQLMEHPQILPEREPTSNVRMQKAGSEPT